jgi:hypothetical protein
MPWPNGFRSKTRGAVTLGVAGQLWDGDVATTTGGVSAGQLIMPVMADRSPVLRIISSAARDSLKPLGLAQRGRSRLWIDDHGWWLGVVDFTPARIAGSGLVVGAIAVDHDAVGAWVTRVVGSCRSKLGLDPAPFTIS